MLDAVKIKNLAQQVLGTRAVKYLVLKSRTIVYGIAMLFWPLRALYFTVLNQGFYFEQRAVASGVYKYNKGNLRTSPELRRNIHRLEKGLTTKNRRSEFGLGFILETVRELESKHNLLDEAESNWSFSVLHEYFQVVQSKNPNFNKAETAFSALIRKTSREIETFDSGPFLRAEFDRVSYEDLLGLAQHRRSVRTFLPKQVEYADIQKAVELAIQSPSSCNRLPFRLIISEGDQSARDMLSLPFGASGWGNTAQRAIAVVGDFSSFFSPRDRHSVYTDASLFTMSFCFALETLGISSTLVNWPELAVQDYRAQRLLRLKRYEKVVMFVALGYSDSEQRVPRSGKKMPETFVELRDG